MLRPRSVAIRTVAPAGDAELLHQRGVEPDREPRRVGKLVREMVDAGVDVDHAALVAVARDDVGASSMKSTVPFGNRRGANALT